MALAREIRVEMGEDYFLSLPRGALYLWTRAGDPQIVPLNDAARAQQAAGPAASEEERTVQVIVLGSARRLALVSFVGELAGPARARVRALLARELPEATPVFCSNETPGAAVAVSAPHEGEAAPEPGEIAACVAVVKAGFGWDETPVMSIEADGVRCTVEMAVGGDAGLVRVSLTG